MVTLEHRGLPWPWMILPLQSKYNKQMQCIASHHHSDSFLYFLDFFYYLLFLVIVYLAYPK